MNFFQILDLLGGVALFLYGMHIMGRGLTRLAGNRLQMLLEKLTSNHIKALLLGLFVTVIIQSSSATTVMVVGLVNSNLMGLMQGIYVNMGADIGTTVTAWLLSLTSIGGDSGAVSYLTYINPLSYLPILSIVGVIFVVFIKNTKRYNLGSIMLGFVIIMYGMDVMKQAVAPLQNSGIFKEFIFTISHPLLAAVFGLVMTLIIQSSSASIGMLQALSITGLINYSVALPIIIGCNIGTCITALISSVSASVDGKRAAVSNFLFKFNGAVVIVGAFYIINVFADFKFLGLTAAPVGIAVIHTTFNVLNAFLHFWNTKYLYKLVMFLLPEKAQALDAERAAIYKSLDERFLNAPAFAVEQSIQTTLTMGNYAKEAYEQAIKLVSNYTEDTYLQVEHLEKLTDEMEDALSKYTLKLSTHRMSDSDNNRLTMVMHCLSYFERIGDRALALAKAAKEMHEKDLKFSQSALAEIEVLSRAVDKILSDTLQVFSKQDNASARKIEPLEEVVDYLNYKIRKRHVKRLQAGTCTVELGFIMTDMTTALERVSDHCSAIALSILEMANSEYGAHAFAVELKGTEPNFQATIDEYKQLFALPAAEVDGAKVAVAAVAEKVAEVQA